MEWTAYWQQLLRRNKLSDKVKEMDAYDEQLRTEQICRGIYECYEDKEKELLEVKRNCMKELECIEGVHLSCGRVKSKESLLCKVIKKRNENIAAFDSKYYRMDAYNYGEIITDLVGLRLIINYRGKWLTIHRQILELFPLAEERLYEERKLLGHDLKSLFVRQQFQAEWPRVYYAEGDDVGEYEKEGLDTYLNKGKYRGIHYILSFENTYIELQLRTIYDEAWSDCDHNYVYKKEHNSSYGALKNMSEILNELTNISEQLNDVMKVVFDGEKMKRNQEKTGWITETKIVDNIDKVFKGLQQTEKKFQDFRKIISDMQEEKDETGEQRS